MTDSLAQPDRFFFFYIKKKKRSGYARLADREPNFVVATCVAYSFVAL